MGQLVNLLLEATLLLDTSQISLVMYIAFVRKKKNEWHHALQQTPKNVNVFISFTLGCC